MASQARVRQAVIAWREQLITQNEALEIAGAEDAAELLAAAGFEHWAPDLSGDYECLRRLPLRAGADAGR